MTKLTFLGTAGGRFATLTQARATGGLYLEDGAARVHIDPGPGALLQLHAAGIDPTATTGLLVSHAHLDHANDVNILVEAITRGGTEHRGFLVGSESVVHGLDGQQPILLSSHRRMLAGVEVATAGKHARVSGLRVEFLPTEHRDKSTVGFKITTSAGVVTYYTDSVYRADLVKPLEGSRVLILGVTRPRGAPIEGHLTTDDAAAIADAVKPELLLLTHLGLKVLRAGPDQEARFIEEKTGVRTVAARDLTSIIAAEKVNVRHHEGGQKKQHGRRPTPRHRRR